jgi:flagellar FliJ protein
MRFRYAFQKIVDLKNNERTQAEWVLSEAIGHLRAEEETLAHLQTAKTQMQEQMISVSAGKATISQLMLLQHYVDHIGQQIEEKNKHVEEAQKLVLNKREHLAGKMLEEKVWTKAKEKAYQRFTAKLLNKEQQELDEIATNRFARMP